MFFLSCVCFAFVHVRFICALWSPAGKVLTSWLLFVVSNYEFVTFFIFLFDLILYVHSTIFQLCGTVFLG